LKTYFLHIISGLLFLISIDGTTQIIVKDSIDKKMDGIQYYLLYRNHDSTYIRSYADQFALKLVAVNKINYFGIKDKNTSAGLRYRPEYGVNLGIGVSYKWFALDLAFNLGIRENKDFENSEYFDFQGRIFSSKQFIEGSLQYYYGHLLANISGIDEEIYDIPEIRDDIRTISFGLQYLYAFNYDKFSLKAPFVLNEIQLKSAGSPILGASFAYFSMDADSSIVPQNLMEYFDPKLHMTDFNVISLAVNAGYMYTFVWKEHFFITLGLIPGLNFNLGDSKAGQREPFRWNVSYRIKTMNALGYNGRRFFTGFQFVGDWNNIRIYEKLHTKFTHGSLKFFVGYRFRNKKNKTSIN
jgi:hypothetical protein